MRRAALAALAALLASAFGMSATNAAEPTVTLAPSSGPAGTTVHFEGDGFTDPSWRQLGEQPLILLEHETASCDYILTPDDGRASVDGAGHLAGSFTVPSQATCSQGDGSSRAAPAATYRLAVRCVACLVGEFDLERPGPAGSSAGWRWAIAAVLAVALGAAAALVRRRRAPSPRTASEISD